MRFCVFFFLFLLCVCVCVSFLLALWTTVSDLNKDDNYTFSPLFNKLSAFCLND